MSYVTFPLSDSLSSRSITITSSSRELLSTKLSPKPGYPTASPSKNRLLVLVGNDVGTEVGDVVGIDVGRRVLFLSPSGYRTLSVILKKGGRVGAGVGDEVGDEVGAGVGAGVEPLPTPMA